jgi:hypothetical protein
MNIDRIILWATFAGVVILLLFGSIDIDVSDDSNRNSAPVVATL